MTETGSREGTRESCREWRCLGSGGWEMPTAVLVPTCWRNESLTVTGREALSRDSEIMPLAPFSLHAVCRDAGPDIFPGLQALVLHG